MQSNTGALIFSTTTPLTPVQNTKRTTNISTTMHTNVSNKTLTTQTSATYSSQKDSPSYLKTTTSTPSAITYTTSISGSSSRTSQNTSSSSIFTDVSNTDLISSTRSLPSEEITTMDFTQKIKYTSKSSLDISNIDIAIGKRNQTVDSRSETSTTDSQDESLTPLLIGLGIGIFVGLIMGGINTGIIFWLQQRHRKNYTRRFDDELGLKARSGSNGRLNDGHDDQEESHVYVNDKEEKESN